MSWEAVCFNCSYPTILRPCDSWRCLSYQHQRHVVADCFNLSVHSDWKINACHWFDPAAQTASWCALSVRDDWVPTKEVTIVNVFYILRYMEFFNQVFFPWGLWVPALLVFPHWYCFANLGPFLLRWTVPSILRPGHDVKLHPHQVMSRAWR